MVTFLFTIFQSSLQESFLYSISIFPLIHYWFLSSSFHNLISLETVSVKIICYIFIVKICGQFSAFFLLHLSQLIGSLLKIFFSSLDSLDNLSHVSPVTTLPPILFLLLLFILPHIPKFYLLESPKYSSWPSSFFQYMHLNLL